MVLGLLRTAWDLSKAFLADLEKQPGKQQHGKQQHGKPQEHHQEKHPAPARMPGQCAASAVVPGSCVDMGPWKLQLAGAVAYEIVKMPQLATYTNPDCFHTMPHPSGAHHIVMSVAAGGDHSSGSRFPRCELAETTYSGHGGGWAPLWSIPGEVVHTMTWTGSTQQLTPVRPVVVVAQIKAAVNTPVQIRVTGDPRHPGTANIKLALFNKKCVMLDPKYVLGTPYTMRIVAGRGKIAVFYNDLTTPAAVLDEACPETAETQCYFKLGNYLQSNVGFGEAADAKSVVCVHALHVEQA